MSADNTKMTNDPSLLAELNAAAALPDDDINLGDPDAPEALDWTGAVRGRFYGGSDSPGLHLDADVLRYFKASGPDYEVRINRALRAAMLREQRRQGVLGQAARRNT